MSTQSQIEHPIADSRISAPQGRLRDRGMLGTPVLVIVIALYHLAAYWSSPPPTRMAIKPPRVIHVVRAEHQKLPPATGSSLSKPSDAPDDQRAFDPEDIPAPWPYGAGWRCGPDHSRLARNYPGRIGGTRRVPAGDTLQASEPRAARTETVRKTSGFDHKAP